MKIANLFGIIVLFCLICLKGMSQTSTLPAEDELTKRGEVYFRFRNTPFLDMSRIIKLVSVDHASNLQWIYAYANQVEFKNFKGLNIAYEMLQHPGTLIIPRMENNIDLNSKPDWDFYPTYEAYVDLMDQFSLAYPALCEVFSIGTTMEGRDLLVAKISANVGVQEAEPRFLYVSSIHGDELTGYVLMLRLIDYLLTHYGYDPKVTGLLDHTEIWINPLANPDGTYAGGNETVFGATRYNSNNVDLNRNYPDPQDGPHPDGNGWQPETEAFMNLADSVKFIIAANFHGGAEVFNYPWDTWSQLHADDDWWQFVGREWADTVHEHSPAGYFDDQDNGITNGFAWYEVNGGRQDFMNYFHECREVTVEISNVKIIPESQLPEFWEYNFRSILNYMYQSGFGFRGSVSDSASGNPLPATITVLNHDNNNSSVSTDADGNYYRVIFDGTYDVKFAATGHKSKIIESVEVVNMQSLQLDVQLAEGSDGLNEIKAGGSFEIKNNHAKGTILISYSGSEPVQAVISIVNVKGSIVLSLHNTFGKESQTLSIQVNHLKPGLYITNIIAGIESFSGKIILR
jgi:hypothetical protein